jgi:hypothetical protein
MSDDDLRERFFRERRLLLGVSVVLLAHQLLGITVGKAADTLGLHFEINDPAQIWWAVWAVWLWTAVSAAQQLNTLKPKSEYPHDRDEETRYRLSDWVAVRKVRQIAKPRLRSLLSRQSETEFNVAFVGRHGGTSNGHQFVYTRVRITAQWQCDAANEAAQKASAFDQEMRTASCNSVRGSSGFENGACRFERLVDVNALAIRSRPLIRFASSAWTMLSTSFLTDYVLPMIIAAAPIIVAVVQIIAHGLHCSHN